MSKPEKTLLAVAIGLMGCTFVFPLWSIRIWAPQYPEGLAIQIGLSSVTGNLPQINILNHYIGMKHITPASIPELKIMPRVMLLLIGCGALATLIGLRWVVVSWFFALLSLDTLGLFDFWRWGYDYGHHLSPDAPIRIPGMSYQPPLFGHKKLMNIDAYSFPDLGGWAMALAIVLIFVALYAGKARSAK